MSINILNVIFTRNKDYSCHLYDKNHSKNDHSFVLKFTIKLSAKKHAKCPQNLLFIL